MLTALILFSFAEMAIFWRRMPSDDLKTIQDFREWMPNHTNTFKVTVRGSTYYGVKGPFTRLLPSGKSLYVFDDNGNPVDWSSDAGDNRAPAIVFDEDAVQTPISIEELPGQEEDRIDHAE